MRASRADSESAARAGRHVGRPVGLSSDAVRNGAAGQGAVRSEPQRAAGVLGPRQRAAPGGRSPINAVQESRGYGVVSQSGADLSSGPQGTDRAGLASRRVASPISRVRLPSWAAPAGARSNGARTQVGRSACQERSAGTESRSVAETRITARSLLTAGCGLTCDDWGRAATKRSRAPRRAISEESRETL